MKYLANHASSHAHLHTPFAAVLLAVVTLTQPLYAQNAVPATSQGIVNAICSTDQSWCDLAANE